MHRLEIERQQAKVEQLLFNVQKFQHQRKVEIQYADTKAWHTLNSAIRAVILSTLAAVAGSKKISTGHKTQPQIRTMVLKARSSIAQLDLTLVREPAKSDDTVQQPQCNAFGNAKYVSAKSILDVRE